MSRTRLFATTVACFAIAIGSFAFLYRNELLVAYHCHRLTAEIKAWQAPPPAGQSKDFRNYPRVEFELSKLVALGALDRVELQMRLYTDGAFAALPSLNRIENGQNPAPVFHHIKGDPRIQPQAVVIWCEPNDTLFWNRFANSTLEPTATKDGEPSDSTEPGLQGFANGQSTFPAR